MVFLNMLQNGQPAAADAWPRLAEYLEDQASEGDIAAICGKLTAERIQVLCGADPDSAKRIGLVFSEWVSNADFNFYHCDAIADRVENIFFEW